MTDHRAISPPAATLESCLDRIHRHFRRARELFMNARDFPADLSRPLVDAAHLFEELKISYVLIGGVAAMIYGRPRPTEDVDFVASVGHKQVLQEHSKTMQKHGFDPTCTWKLYHESGVAIDIWKDIHAAEIISRAVLHPFAQRTIPVAEPHDLIAMKLRANRIQDDYDISEILKHTPIDDAIVRRRVEPEQFEHYLAIRRRIGMA